MEKSTLRICNRSDAGIRTGNEDACGVQRYDHPLGTVYLLAVADGLGGHPAGEIASALAVSTLMRVMGDQLSLIRDLGVEQMKQLMEQAFLEANNAVIAAGEQNMAYTGLGTTLVAAMITEADDCIIGSIGDSRAYLVAQRMRRITRDHSRVQELVEEGILTPAEAERHPMKHIVTRIVGRRGEQPDIFAYSLGGSRLLLCSDGLMDGLGDPDILAIMRGMGIPGICDTLVEKARERSRDNITVVVAEWIGRNDLVNK
ncbi:MAG: protein phosphatase 2C domain-containing protein [Methanoregulaceae archaeon]|nr:protein phosphatase 2C domain-containing protein [Methanoregulaceae archaeon]